jgi:glutathione transport system permease protein
MRSYAIRRILQIIPVTIVVSMIVFAIIRLIPGDPAANMAGSDATPQTIATIRKSLGLDKPIYTQYLTYLGHIVRGDFGRSLANRQPVSVLVIPSAKATLYLAAVALVASLLIGVALGLLAALYRGRFLDRLISTFAMITVSIPPYWVGLLLILYVSVKLGVLPAAGNQSPESVILPATALALGQAAMLIRLVRASFIEILEQDYIRTARHKGLSQAAIVLRHALPNSMGTILTFTGVQLGHLLAGAVVVEVVFAWPGMGRLAVGSLVSRDLPVVQACILIFTVTVLVVNLITDLLCAVVDPRIEG